MLLKEVRKEDDLYFKGPFWIISDSIPSLLKGNFNLEVVKNPCYFDGRYVDAVSKNGLTHKNYWKNKLENIYHKPYNYFPRGRVEIYNGVAYIHLHSLCNTPKIIDKVIEEYGLNKLDIEYDFNDTYQGSHYDFLLK